MLRIFEAVVTLALLAAYILDKQEKQQKDLAESACTVAETMRLQAAYWKDQAEELVGQIEQLERQLCDEPEEVE